MIDRYEVRGLGLSLAELAFLTGISYPRIYRAASGSTNLEPDEFRLVQRVLAAVKARGKAVKAAAQPV